MMTEFLESYVVDFFQMHQIEMVKFYIQFKMYVEVEHHVWSHLDKRPSLPPVSCLVSSSSDTMVTSD